jgi:hypothetical protein
MLAPLVKCLPTYGRRRKGEGAWGCCFDWRLRRPEKGVWVVHRQSSSWWVFAEHNAARSAGLFVCYGRLAERARRVYVRVCV